MKSVASGPAALRTSRVASSKVAEAAVVVCRALLGVVSRAVAVTRREVGVEARLVVPLAAAAVPKLQFSGI